MTVGTRLSCSVIAGTVLCMALAATASGDALSDARRLLSEGKFIEAEVALGTAVETPHLAPEAYYTWYKSLRARGEGERAERKLETAARLAADRADWWLELGLYAAELGRTDVAAAHYITALSIAPGFGQAHVALADLLISLGRRPEAEAQLREGLRADPRFPGNWVALADLLSSRGQGMDALALLEEGLAACPDHTPLSLAQGRIYDGMGESTRALEAYQRAVDASPSDAPAQLHLGRALRARGDLNRAMVCFRRAAKLDATSPEPWVEMAWLVLEDRKSPRAARQFSNKAVALAPENCRANAVHGWTLQLTGQSEQGRELATRTMDAHPSCADAAYALGVAAAAYGDREQAIVWLQQATHLSKEPALTRRASALAKQLAPPEPTAPTPEEPSPEP